MRDYIGIYRNTLTNLIAKDYKNVKFELFSGELAGDSNVLNMKAYLVPYYSDKDDEDPYWRSGILLSENTSTHIPHYDMVSAVVRMPLWGRCICESDFSAIERVIRTNLALSVATRYRPPFYSDYVQDWSEENEIDLCQMMGYSLSVRSVDTHICYRYDDSCDSSAHYIEAFVFVRIDSRHIPDEWVTVSSILFDRYYHAKYPEIYLSEFCDEDFYDERDPDYRMNKKGKQLVYFAIKCLEKI